MSALTETLAKHKTIRENMRLLKSDGSKFSRLVQKSDRLVLELAKMPCASDDEFFAKLTHITEVELEDYGYLDQRRGQ
jgi:hypothetical protein